MLKTFVSGIKMYLDKVVTQLRDEVGWKSETSEELFSETVTTVAGSSYNEATLTYTEPIIADTLKVTFDGVEYTCPKFSDDGGVAYGGVSDTGPDFTEFPFVILSDSRGNTIYTQTAGGHTVSVITETITPTDTFKNEVEKLNNVVQIFDGGTSIAKVESALQDGKLLYFYDSVTDATRPVLHIITGHSTEPDKYNFTPSDSSILAVNASGTFKLIKSLS